MGQARRLRTLAVQYRIRRPRSSRAEFLRRDSPHPGVQARFLEDRRSEVRPGAVAIGGDMPSALRKLEQLPGGRREVADVRRRAALVIDDRDLFALPSKAKHRPPEFLSGPPEEPRGADDPAVADLLLALELRPPVDAERVGGVRFHIRLLLRAVED